MADTMKTLAIRLTMQAQDVYKELGTLDKAMDKFNLKQETAGKKTTQSIVKGVREQTSAKKQMQVEILKGIHQEALAVEKAGKRVASVQKEKTAVIRKANAELASAVEKAARKAVEVTNTVFQQRLAIVKKGSDEWVRLEADRINQVKKLDRQASTAGAKSQRLGKPMEGLGKINRANAELAENFSTITRSLQSGDLAGIASMFGGPIAGAIGTVVDLTLEWTGALHDLGLESQKIDNTWIQLNKTIVQFNEGMDTGILVKLETQLQALQRPLGMSEESLIRIAQKLAVKTPPESLVAATKAALDLRRVTTALGEEISVDKMVGTGIGALTGVTQDAAEAADILALVSTKLAGVVEGGLDEAVTEIGNVASKALGTISDGKKAAQESAAVLVALTDSGFQVSEATSTAEGAYESLTALMTDPKLLDAVAKKLPEGMSLFEAGLQEGDVSLVKFLDTMKGMGTAGNEMAASLGGAGGDAFNLLLKNADRLGEKLPGLIEEFSNSSGAAARLADSMTPLSVKMQEFNDQQLADMRTNLGRSFQGLIEGSQKSLSSFLSTVATADFSGLGIIGDMLDGIRDLFVDTAVEAERAHQAYLAAASASDDMEELVTQVQGLSDAEVPQALLDNISTIEQVAPGAAAAVKRLAAEADAIDPEKAGELRDILEQAAQLGSGNAAAAARVEVELLLETVGDLAKDAEDIWVTAWDLGGVATATVEMAEAQSSLMSEIAGIGSAGALDVQLEKAEELNALIAERLAMDERGEIALSASERTSLLAKEDEMLGFIGEKHEQITAMQELGVEAVQKILRSREAEAERLKIPFDIDKERERIQARLVDELGDQAFIYEEIAGQLENIESFEEAVAEATEAAVEPNVEIAALLSQQEAAAQALGVSAADNSEQKQKQLEAEIALNESIVAAIDTQILAIDAAIAGEITRAEAVLRVSEAQENLNNLKKDEAAIAAGGTGSGTTALDTVAAVETGNLEAARSALQSQKANIEALNGRIRQTIQDMGAGARQEQEKQNKEAAKARDKAAKDAEKARQEALSRERVYRDAMDKIRRAEVKAGRDELAERRAAFRQSVADNENRKAAAAELRLQLQGISDTIRGRGAAAVSGSVSGLGNILGISPEGLDKLSDIESDFAVAMEDMTRTRQGELDQIDAQIAVQQAIITRDRGKLVGMGGRDRTEMGGRNRIAGLGRQIQTAEDYVVQLQTRLAQQELNPIADADNQTAALDLLNSEIATYTANIADLKKQMAELKEDVDPLVASLADARGEVSRLGQVRGTTETASEAELTDLWFGGRLEVAAGKTATLTSDLAAMTTEFDRLLQAGTASEEEISKLGEAMGRLPAEATKDQLEAIGAVVSPAEGSRLSDYMAALEGRAATSAGAKAELENLTQLKTKLMELVSTWETYSTDSVSWVDNLEILNGIQTTLKQTQADTSEALGHAVEQEELFTQAQLDSLDPVERAVQTLKGYLAALEDTITALEAQAELQGGMFSPEDIKRLKDARDAFADISKELETGEGIIAEAVQEEMDIAMATFAKVIQTIEQGMSKVVGMVEAIQGGDTGEIVAEGVELTKLVGKTLMQAPYPLNIVGAVLLAAGMIAQVIQTIVEMVVTPVKTRLELAKEAAEAEERIRDLYRAQKEILDGQIASGDRRVDQAWEQVEAQEALIRGLIAESEIIQGLAGKTDEELADEAKRLTKIEADIPDLIEKYGERRKLSPYDIQGTPEQKAESTRQYRQPLVDIGMSESEIDKFLDMSPKDRKDFLEAMGVDVTETLKGIEELQGARGVLSDLERSAIEEEIDLQRTLNRLGQSQEETQKNILGIRRKALNEGLESIGISGAAGMSDEELRDTIRTEAAKPDSQISGIMDLINPWLDSVDAVDALAGSEEKLFQGRKRALAQQRKLGRLTEDEFQEKMLALLQEELAVREGIEDSLVEGVDSAGAILDAGIARRDIEIEIQDLLEGQNSEMLETDSILDGLIRKRQAMLGAFRQGRDGGTLTGDQTASLSTVTAQAVGRLRELGASDDEIQKFLDSLPQYDTGGGIPMDMPIMAHKGEHVVTADQVSAIGQSTLAGISVQSGSMFRTPEARILQQAAMAEREMLSSFAGISQTNNFYGEVKPDDLDSANARMEQEVINIVNRANAQGYQQPRR